MKRIPPWTLLFLILLASPASSEGFTGNDALNGCRGYVGQSTTASAYDQGVCIATIDALLQVGRIVEAPYRFCIPGKGTLGQAARVAIKYMEDHPELLHQSFVTILLKAYNQAWPCK